MGRSRCVSTLLTCLSSHRPALGRPPSTIQPLTHLRRSAAPCLLGGHGIPGRSGLLLYEQLRTKGRLAVLRRPYKSSSKLG